MRIPADAAVAVHRFGLGEAALSAAGDDPRGWLKAQIGPADAQRGKDLPDTAAALVRQGDWVRRQRAARRGDTKMDGPSDEIRAAVRDDLRARLTTAATTRRPFAERLAMFWADHFTVSIAKGGVRGLAGAFERDAIRPRVAGRFEDLLGAAVRHPAMLRYLDNDRSAGPDSRLVQRMKRRRGDEAAVSGLNENLARELLELHTLGVDGGYMQADVTALAAVLTGWQPGGFDPDWHQPGPKTVLGRRYEEGPDALGAVVADLARHPSTARFVCGKLARSMRADPPAALADRLVDAWRRSDGDLARVSAALVDAPEAWDAAPSRLRTPEEFVLAAVRGLGVGEAAFARYADAGIAGLGQRVQSAPSPAGWSTDDAAWLGPEAMWKRLEWAQRVARMAGPQVDARDIGERVLGPWLGDAARREIDRAADGAQALALLLMAPGFQRR